ncbi:MAG: peptidoglycan DD-metalloendopeptidase family protein [Deltaproteobacteria bacterium]|nr:peptidoglycan DD-metalloendopeptidase family protein [Deltaproteobacteria bacterium]
MRTSTIIVQVIYYCVGILLIFIPAYCGAFDLTTRSDHGDIRITSQYRNLHPGEIIKISLKMPRFSSARAYFQGRKYAFAPEQGGSTFLLLGLDLDAKPGIQNLDINIDLSTGYTKKYSFKIPVAEWAFSIRRLSVDERYIVPPPEMRERIIKERALVDSVYRSYTPRWLGYGRFIVPSTGSMRENFGERRIFNNTFHSRHRGVDIRSRRGAWVKAANSGKVVLIHNLYYAGNTVIIDHGLGLFSIYCHLSKVLAKEGEFVRKGDIVGNVGSTGRVTGPHLHWGVMLFDRCINPLSLLHLSFDE